MCSLFPRANFIDFTSCKAVVLYCIPSRKKPLPTDHVRLEPVHDKTYIKTCATSEDSDQPTHLRSLIRVFADRMCLLQPPGYPMIDKQESLSDWMDKQADLNLCWSHRSYCRFCHALIHMSIEFITNLYS